jgi:hypothetical protein
VRKVRSNEPRVKETRARSAVIGSKKKAAHAGRLMTFS